jgi:hypothetical protein
MTEMKRAIASPAVRDLARGLGWFSIALGAAETLAPRALSHSMGLRRWRLTRLFGLREIGTGIGVLTADDPTDWIKGRVAGDALDIAALTAGMFATRRPHSLKLGLLMVLGITGLDILCNNMLEQGRAEARKPVFSYSDRAGYPKGIEQARGAARQHGET